MATISAIGSAMADDNMQGKDVAYRGGLVKFQIPANWVTEQDSDGQAAFYEDVPGSGTLRIHVLTLKSEKPVVPASAVEVLVALKDAAPEKVQKLRNGNVLATLVQRTREEGTPITLFWWYLASNVPPDHVRIATFSYTIHGSQERSEGTQRELAFLERSIQEARLHPELGGAGK